MNNGDELELLESAELVNSEVLEILEKLEKVTLAFRGWVITLVFLKPKN
jgi:hypothetical protein